MYVGYIYVIVHPLDTGFSKLYAAARAIPMQLKTRAITLKLNFVLGIVALDFFTAALFAFDQKFHP
jgi:hypothetical protein